MTQGSVRSGAVASCRDDVRLRPVGLADLPAVLDLQARVYAAAYHESDEVFASRVGLAPGGCWLAEHRGRAAGYVFAHPWAQPVPPQLHTALCAAGQDLPACRVFLHDMAVCPQLRGAGLAQALFGRVRAWAAAQGASELMLVSLAGARGFWQRLGFAADERTRVDGYGEGACCMRMVLSA